MAEAGQSAGNDDAAAEWEALARQEEAEGQDTPVVDSPSISADWPAEGEGRAGAATATGRRSRGTMPRTMRSAASRPTPRGSPACSGCLPCLACRPCPSVGLPTACAAMGALVLALVIWRADIVRLLPQTATFYKMVGLDVNLRGLAFKDIKITNETVDGKPVLVIEGVIVGETRKPVELPRLRF